MYYYNRDVDEIDVGTRLVESGYVTDNSAVPSAKPFIPGGSGELPDFFYVEDRSGSDNTVAIKKYYSDAPTLTVQYSRDGRGWIIMGETSTTAITATVPANGKLYFRCSANSWCDSSSMHTNMIYCSGNYNVGGNIMSLLYGQNFKGTEKTVPNNTARVFNSLFYNSTKLISASNLTLPITTMLGYDYQYMFKGCTALTSAPALPATTLANNCYKGMFDGCSSLSSAPLLNSTSLAASCYQEMFQSCTSLVTAPALPATTLADYCYSNMFNSCTHLTSAPVLNATALTTYCYSNMFAWCTSLSSAPALPATTLATYCYKDMFLRCSSLTTAPELPATTLTNYCYYEMFDYCTNLSYIKCLATNISATNCLYRWVYSVSASGTFVKDPDATWPAGENGIPSGWTTSNYKKTTAISLNKNSTTINTGDTEQLTATVTPPNSTETVIWSSSNTSIATVSSTGLVTSVGEGSAIITATSGSYSATCSVTVEAASLNWFYVENLTTSSNTVTIKKSNSSAPTIALERSTDGTTWTNWGSTSTTGVTYSIPSKGKVYIRSKNKVSQWHGSGTYRNWINCSGDYAVGGNIMSLQYGPDFTGNERTFYDSSASYGVFMALFMNSSKLISIEKLVMPVTTMLTYCYANMFQQCTGLTTINKDLLPATTLATYCYSNMFYNCNKITEAPELPAPTLKQYCYQSMFYNCTSLNYMKVRFTANPNWSSSSADTYRATYNWTYGLPASGTYWYYSTTGVGKNASGNKTTGTSSSTGYCNGYPYNWTTRNYGSSGGVY